MKTAFLFPGQGSQFIGMEQSLDAAFPEAHAIFAEADDLLGWKLSDIMANGPEEELRRTDRTQPALYVTSAAALAALKSRGVAPTFAAGHSVGEYAALLAADVFDFATGLRLVQLRSEAMHRASQAHPGGMAALLGMEESAAREICDTVTHEHKGVIEVANLNSAGQVVISGDERALDLAIRLARMKGVLKVIPLKVAGAWHCPLMKVAEEELAPSIRAAAFRDPKITVVANVTAKPILSAEMARDLLIRQVCGSVRWSDCVLEIAQSGAERFLEVGAGGVLTGLMKRIKKDAVATRAGTAEEIADCEKQMKNNLNEVKS